MSGKPRVREAAIGEGMQSCDICGRVGKVGEFASIYFGDKGQKLDVCSTCLKEGKLNEGRK
ncbi:MAG: hypothetical protein QXK53_07710 [Nitrososphaerota archaeon]